MEARSERLFVRAALVLIPTLVLFAFGLRVGSGRTYVYLYDFSVAALAFGPLGALILSRRPRHAIGALFLGLGFAWSVQVAFGSMGTGWSAGLFAALAMAIRFVGLAGAGFVILLFPTGSTLTPRWRIAGSLLGIGALVSAVGVLIASGPIEDAPRLSNPIGITPMGLNIFQVGFVLVILGVFGAVASAVVRFRRARGDERQQLKLFALACAGTVLLIVAANIAFPRQVETTVLGNIVWDSPSVLLPAAVTISILRYGLYDLGRILSRTLSYAILTAILFGTYSLTVLALGAALRPLIGSTDVVVAMATLLVAACFGPLRRRVQTFIDRRFDRARYDAARTIEAFNAHLREEFDLDSLRSELAAVIHGTMAPASVSLWLNERLSRSATVSE